MSETTRGQVTLATLNEHEAAYWQGLFESHGIPVSLVGADASAADVGTLSVALQVSGEVAEHAGSLMKAQRSADASEIGRALMTAFVGLGIPPIQLYSAYLVARLMPRWRGLSGDDRRRVASAALLSLWLPFMVTACVLYLWTGS